MNKQMNAMSRLSQYLFAIVVTLLSAATYADQASFDNAVNEYLKGFRACSDANTLRSTNIIEANKKFAYYRQQLDLAVSIDESILTSTERDMDKNLAYCKRVEDNLKRAEATPVLEHAFTYCEAARNSFDQNKFDQARQEFEEYRRYKEDAFAITATIGEVFVLASQVRSCARFEEKLIEQEQLANKRKELLVEAVNLYQTFKLECDSTLAYLKREAFDINDLPTANKMLNEALKNKKAAEDKRGGLDYAVNNPEDENAIKLAQLKESAQVCEGQVAEAIRDASKEQRDMKSRIRAQNSNLKISLDKCKAAQNEVKVKNLNAASAAYRDSAALKKKAVASNVVDLVKANPAWQESKDYTYLTKLTKSCHSRTAKSIRALRKTLEAAKQQQKAKQEEKAKPKPKPKKEEPKKEEPKPKADKKQDSVLPKEEELDNLDDWEEDDDFLGDFEEEDEDNSPGRDWTELIK